MELNFISSEQGKLGLPNVGNSCYLNSTIQCLAGTKELLQYFFQSAKINNGEIMKRYKIDMAQEKKIKNNKTQNKNNLTDAWFNLLMQLWATKEQLDRVNPIPFYRLIGQVANESKVSISISGDQNDFQEFLILLMDSLHDSLSRETKMNIVGEDLTHMDKMSRQAYLTYIKHFEKDYSIFVKLFIGQINTTTVGECGHKSEIFDPIKFFPLVIPMSNTPVSLEDLFNNYSKESKLIQHTLNGEVIDDRWFCDQCKTKVNAITKNTIWDLPKYLIISLGRYQFFPRPIKINTPVYYPLENLDMSKYYSGFKNQSLKYNLYAVSNHFGNQNGGHYTAFRKNPDGKWYHFNDENVSEINDPENTIINNGAYCLFYELV
jgi:ubiquitin C-terminal hydrolase